MNRVHPFALGAIYLIAITCAVALPPPAALTEQRWIAGLAAAVILGVAALAALRFRSHRVWAPVAAVGLISGIAAFIAYQQTRAACTAHYAGRIVVVGTELRPEVSKALGAGIPSKDELLFDAAGVRERVWTDASIARCELHLRLLHAAWLPLLAVAIVAMASPALGRRLPASAPAGSAPGRPPATIRYDAFISYRHGEPDAAFTRAVVEDLEAAGYRVAIDERDFAPNEHFLAEMERCIRESRFTLSVISQRYLGSGNCEEEAVISKVLDMGERKRRLIPLIIERVEMPAWLYGLVGIDFTARQALVDPLEKLRATLGRPQE